VKVIAPQVVIAEDDAELRAVLLRGLAEEGFAPRGAATGGELLDQVQREAPDLLVVDIGLPDSDGRDVCQALRAQGIQTPILFLTARSALTDRVTGFSAGGDDYLTKPFEFAELIARLRALHRRSAGTMSAVVAGDLRLDPATHGVLAGGKTMPLTPTEYRLLGALAGRPGETVRRRELIASGWPSGAIVHDNTLDVYLARLRKKLGELPTKSKIGTVHGVGYRLE